MIPVTGSAGNDTGLHIASHLLHPGVAACASTLDLAGQPGGVVADLERRIDPAT